jgi:hypothetical protein
MMSAAPAWPRSWSSSVCTVASTAAMRGDVTGGSNRRCAADKLRRCRCGLGTGGAGDAADGAAGRSGEAHAGGTAVHTASMTPRMSVVAAPSSSSELSHPKSYSTRSDCVRRWARAVAWLPPAAARPGGAAASWGRAQTDSETTDDGGC